MVQAIGTNDYHRWMTVLQVIRKVVKWLIKQEVLPQFALAAKVIREEEE